MPKRGKQASVVVSRPISRQPEKVDPLLKGEQMTAEFGGKKKGLFESAANKTERRLQTSSRGMRLNAELLRTNLGGTATESDVFKECIRQLSQERLLSLMPAHLLKQRQERSKTNTTKFDALGVFLRLWRAYVQKL